MARPEIEPKTALGRRLRDVRRRLEFDDRDKFAAELEIGKGSLAHYERGERVPDATVLAAYAERFGIDVGWLVTGRGEMFGPHSSMRQGPESLPANAQTWVDLIGPLGRLIHRVHRDCGVRLTGDQAVSQLARWHHAVTARVSDPFDWGKLMEQLVWVEDSIRAELAEKAENLRTSKPSA